MWTMRTNLDAQKYERWIWIDREVSTESVSKVQKPVLEHTEKKVENFKQGSLSTRGNYLFNGANLREAGFYF